MRIVWLLLVTKIGGYTTGIAILPQLIIVKAGLYPEPYKSLNYVLNEQLNQMIEVFIEMLKVDNETNRGIEVESLTYHCTSGF